MPTQLINKNEEYNHAIGSINIIIEFQLQFFSKFFQ